MKKLLSFLVILICLFGNPIDLVADDSLEKNMPKRNLILDFANPLNSFEGNSNTFYLINQLFGRGNDYLGIKLDLDKNLAGRLSLSLIATYLSYTTAYYPHEIAHDFEFRKHGLKHTFKLDFSNWSWLSPKYIQEPKNYSILSQEEKFRSIVNGLNQGEFNAEKSWEQSLLNGDLNFYDNLSFLLNKLQDLAYILYVGLKEKRLSEINHEIPDLIRFYKRCDVDLYTGMLYNKGINLSKKEYFAQILIVDMLLTLHTWESFALIGKYLLKGTRRTSPKSLRLSKDVEISPPLCSLYLTPNGSFCNMSFFVNPEKKNLMKLCFGTDLDFVGHGKVNQLRFGGEYYYLSLPLGIKLNPFTYLNMNRSFKYEGFSAGAKVYLPIANRIGLRVKVEYNRNDIIENIVKGEKNGFNIRIGLKARI